MLIIKTVLNTPIASQYLIRKDFMNFMCKAGFANNRGLWLAPMLEVPDLYSDETFGGLLQAMVYTSIEQANASFEENIKARELLQMVAPDLDPAHFKRRAVATSDEHVGMGHPVYYIDAGLKLVYIDKKKLVDLTPWEQFIADYESIIRDNSGSWEFYEHMTVLWDRSIYNNGVAMLKDVDWHEPSKTLEAKETLDEIASHEDVELADLARQTPRYLPHSSVAINTVIPTPSHSPAPDAPATKQRP